MSQEYPSQGLLKRITGKLNDVASRVGLLEDERSFLLKCAGMKLHGDKQSQGLETLRDLVGPFTAELLEAWVGNHLESLRSDLIEEKVIIQLEEDLRATRKDEDWLRELPL